MADTEAPAASNSRFSFDEKHWAWKAALRAFTIIICIIGIGIFGWAAAYKYSASYMSDYYDWLDGSVTGFFIIPLAFSVIFNLIVLLVLFLRKRPAHPGIAVGVDLILWLALLSTGLLATVGALDAMYWSPDYESSYYENGQYVYNATLGYDVYVPDNSSQSACYPFDSCAEEESAQQKIAHRGIVEFVGVAMTFVALLLHFVLFVWACVDTHRRNAKTTQSKARVIADQIIAEMREQGTLQAAGAQAATQPLLSRPAEARKTPREDEITSA